MIITDFEIVDHGIQNEQYFQGCGTSCTPFEFVQTGIGNNPAEAIDDCLEQIASGSEDIDIDGMESRILQDIGKRRMPTKPSVKSSQTECYYYLSIRYNAAVDRPDIADDDITIDHIPDVAESRAMRARFITDGFSPNVWHINDHGNTDLLSIGYNGAKIVKSWV